MGSSLIRNLAALEAFSFWLTPKNESALVQVHVQIAGTTNLPKSPLSERSCVALLALLLAHAYDRVAASLVVLEEFESLQKIFEGKDAFGAWYDLSRF